MGTREYLWVSKYPLITCIEIPTQIRGRKQVQYLSNRAERISYYPYTWIPINILS